MTEPVERKPDIAFRKVFYVGTTVVAVFLFLTGIAITGNIMVGYAAVSAFIIGTSNGMVWGAYRVQNKEGSCQHR